MTLIQSPMLHISGPEGGTRVPKPFQTDIINSISSALQRESRPPCLLRSPTGSGKTYMLAKVLQRISGQQPTLWLWFVPYVTLVAQTIDALITEGAGLTARELSTALNEEPAANLVLLSTAQGVASAKGRASGYNAGNSCQVPRDHIPVRSWPFFRARALLQAVIASFKAQQHP